MPQGKGTYGKKVGRPKKRTYKPKFKKFGAGDIVANTIAGFQAKKMQKEFEQQASEAEKNIDAFDKSKLELKGSSTLQEMVDQPISQSLVEGKQDARKTTEATGLNVSQKGGAKTSMAGLQAILESGQQGDLAQMQEQQKATTDAQKLKATEEEAQNVQKQSIAAAELKGMQDSLAESKEGALAARLAKNEAFTTAVTEGVNTASDAAGVGEKGMITPKKGKPQVSDGEFSHKKNPIDITIAMEDENKSDMMQNGEKVGELTGGEAIFNPEDTQKMQDLVDAKDADGLLEHMDMLFKRFEKQDLEHMNNEADKQKANKGSLVGGQKRLDANKDGVISGDDFKILREKNKAMAGTKVSVKGSYRPQFKFNR
tara:strand:+ start:9177 stop:10286 length:1110 start_codon:yes stop_codon:yes gene_type:complete